MHGKRLHHRSREKPISAGSSLQNDTDKIILSVFSAFLAKNFIIDVWQSPNYASGTCSQILDKIQRQGNTQPDFSCSKSTMETPEYYVKSVLSKTIK